MGETDLVAKSKAPARTRKTATEKVAVTASAKPPRKVTHGVVETPAKKPFDPAAWMHQRLVHQIVDFEKNLGPDHEIGGRFVGGPNAEVLHISNVASWGPDMIMFMGEYSDGRRFELMQHYSQVSVLLVAVPTMNEEPKRIGFELLKTVKDQPHPWGDPVS